LQAALFDEMTHSVEALSEMLLCIFPRERLSDLYQSQPGLAADLTWLAVREGQALDQHLITVGRRRAIERLAFFIVQLYLRARDVGLVNGHGFAPPITQQHVADTLGMSIVHTNKTLRRLFERQIIRWKGRQVEILDLAELKAIALWDDTTTGGTRPLI
jgi:CRP-like cAMP-binding protein